MSTPAIYGYCRISTRKQKLERQEQNILREYPGASIVREVFTGTTAARPRFVRLLAQVKPGDTIVFDEVSRMSRDAEEGFALYRQLYEKGVELVFLKEPHISTRVFRQSANLSIAMTGTDADLILEGVNRYLLCVAEQQIRLAFRQAAQEVALLHRRTSEGMQAAKAQGKRVGTPKGARLTTRKSVAAKAQIARLSREWGGSLTDKELIALTGLARNTYYKYKRELRTQE